MAKKSRQATGKGGRKLKGGVTPRQERRRARKALGLSPDPPVGPGRPKGLPNRATREWKEWIFSIMEKPRYQKRIERELLSGKMHPAQELYIWQMCYGKPRDKVEVSGGGLAPKAFSLLIGPAAPPLRALDQAKPTEALPSATQSSNGETPAPVLALRL